MKTITVGDYKKQLKTIMSDENVTYELNEKEAINRGAISCDNHITIGFGNICLPDIKPINISSDKINKSTYKHCEDTDVIPATNYVLSLMTAFHEKRHAWQQNSYKDPDSYSEDLKIMAMDTMVSQISTPWYSDHYHYLSHELDAERAAIIDTFDFLVDNEIMTEDEAEKAVIDVVMLKCSRFVSSNGEDLINGYWVSPFLDDYKTLSDVVRDFDKKYEDCKTYDGDPNFTRLDRSAGYHYSRSVNYNYVKSMPQYNKLVYTDKQSFREVRDAKGVDKLEKLVSLIDKVNPEASKNYPIIKDMGVNIESSYGHDVRIGQSLRSRFMGMIEKNSERAVAATQSTVDKERE